MPYTLKKTEKSTVILSIEVSKEDFEKHRKKAAEEMSKSLNIKGFRPGKVPLDVLEKHIDPSYIDAEATDLAIKNSYAEAVIKENLQVVATPQIKFLSDTKKVAKGEETLKFEAEVAVMPEAKVKDYKEIKIKKEEVKVEQKEIDETLEDLKKYFTKWTDVDRAAKKGDRVEIDFEGFEHKEKDENGNPKSIPNTASKNHPVIIGEGSLIPGFEDHLEGMKKDEKKEFEISFPADYHKKDFQNKKALFKVEMKRLEEPTNPELNDEFAEKVTGQKMSVDDLKKDIEKNILARKQEQAEVDRENKYIEKVLEKTEVVLPEAMVEEEVDYIIEDLKQDLSQRGVADFEAFLVQAKTTMEDLRKKYKPEAEKRIKIRLALTHIIKEEKLEITDAEVEEYAERSEGAGAPGHVHDEHCDHHHKLSPQQISQIKNRLLLKKLFDKVLA